MDKASPFLGYASLRQSSCGTRPLLRYAKQLHRYPASARPRLDTTPGWIGAKALHTIAFVPARGGSKGIPRKNLVLVGGISLVGRAVRVANQIPEIDEVVVSSDDEEILREARTHGATTERRAAEFAADETPTLAVLLDYLKRNPQIDVLVLLQPTSPLRTAADVASCLAGIEQAPTAATVTPVEHPPEWVFSIDQEGRLEPAGSWDDLVDRRQDAPKRFRLNGAVYAIRADHLRSGGRIIDEQTVGVVMPHKRSLDIDTELDLELARLLVERSGERPDTANPVSDGGQP